MMHISRCKVQKRVLKSLYIYLNKLKVICVTLPAQKARHACGMPRARQHGVWSMWLAKQEKVMFAHGAHTIRSGISVMSAFFGSHIRSRQVRCVIPFFTQHPRTSKGNTTHTKKHISTHILWLKGYVLKQIYSRGKGDCETYWIRAAEKAIWRTERYCIWKCMWGSDWMCMFVC